jgi:hypothetical protein
MLLLVNKQPSLSSLVQQECDGQNSVKDAIA